jgi:hypothetical protein
MDPDPTPFFIDAKEAKSKKNFVINFFYNLPKGTSSSAQKFNFLTEDDVLKLYFAGIFLVRSIHL